MSLFNASGLIAEGNFRDGVLTPTGKLKDDGKPELENLSVKFNILFDNASAAMNLPQFAQEALAEGLTLRARNKIRAVAVNDDKPSDAWEAIKAALTSDAGIRLDWRGLTTLDGWSLPSWEFPNDAIGQVASDLVAYLPGATIDGVKPSTSKAFYDVVATALADEKRAKAIAKALDNAKAVQAL